MLCTSCSEPAEFEDDEGAGAKPTYEGAYVGEIRENLDPNAAGQEPFDGVFVELDGATTSSFREWSGNARVRLAVMTARLDAYGNPAVDGDGEMVAELAGWLEFAGTWTDQKEMANPTFELSTLCAAVEVVARPDLQLSCTSDVVPDHVGGRCTQQAATQLWTCNSIGPIGQVTLRQAE
jgi:hypothetical protein